MKKKEKWIDIARGILIFFVVLGHSTLGANHGDKNNFCYYIYLFHIPAFFILSGCLYKSSTDKVGLQVKKKFRRLLIPYMSYIIVINLPRVALLLINNWRQAFSEIYDLFYGGQHLKYYVGAFWFITCLFFVEVFFILLDKYMKNDKEKIIVIFLFYVIAHIHSKYFSKVAFPFAIDVSFIALAYYAFGYYFNQYIISKYIFLSSAILSVFFIIAIRLNIIDYGLEMWAHNYKNFILDFVIPIVISIFIFNFSKYLEDVWCSNFIAEIGKYTLPIMAMHIAISRGIIKTIIGGDYNYFMFTILGVMIPYLIAKYILQKSKILKLLFGI